MSTKRTYSWIGCIVIVLILSSLLPACDTLTAQSAGKIRFGATMSLTGTYSREGQATQQGYDLWAELVNKQGGLKVGGKRYMVEIVYYDDQSDPTLAAKLAEKLITEDKVDLILGPYSSLLTQSVSQVTEQHKMIMVQGSGATDSLFERNFKYNFGVLTLGSYYMKALLERASQLQPKPKTLVIAAEDTAFPRSVATGAQKWAAEYGIQVVAFDKFPAGIADLAPLLSKFKALNPDMFIGTTYIETSMLMVKQAKQVGFSPKIIALSVGPATPSFLDGLGNDAEYIWGATQWEKEMSYKDPVFGSAAGYAERFKAKYGEWPGYQNAEATAAALVYQLALEKAGSLDREQIRAAIAQLDVETFFGPIHFDETGKNASKPMAAIQIQNKQRVLVAPLKIQVKDPLYPMPAWEKR